MDERLKRLIARREAAAEERTKLFDQRKAITDLATEEAREDLSDEEDTEFRGLTEKIKAQDVSIADFDERIKELSDEEQRQSQLTAGAEAVRRAQARSQVNEGRTYDQGNGQSYFRDLMRSSLRLDGSDESAERLRRHAIDVQTAPEYRDLTRVDGAGGYFVPPAWLTNQWIELPRGGRATADLCNSQPLPGGTDSINIPKVATGTATAIQWTASYSDNAPVQETDLSDTFITAPVRTIAGQQDVAIQLLDQSPVPFDQVIFNDLLADYDAKLDVQVLSGSGSAGQVTGIRSTSSIETITMTSTAAAALYAKIQDALQRVHTLRNSVATVIVMHPRRWAAYNAAFDGVGRPLSSPSTQAPQNAIAQLGEQAARGVVGSIAGVPVVTDPNVPTNVSSTQDVVLVMRASDLLLFESSIRTRVLPEVGSGTLTTRLQVYGYVAFSGARYPKSIVSIGGAGLTTPTFDGPDESSSSSS